MEEKDALKAQIEFLKGNGVKIIIALGHSGLRKDKEMAAELSDVDIIIGGHSHSLLYNGMTRVGFLIEDLFADIRIAIIMVNLLLLLLQLYYNIDIINVIINDILLLSLMLLLYHINIYIINNNNNNVFIINIKIIILIL